MPLQHTVKAYDEELNRLRSTIAQMGGIAEGQLADALQAVARRDDEAAERARTADARTDALEQEVEALAIRLLALRQPMASDLRTIVSSFKIVSDLERIGDYAKNIAKRAIALNQMPAVGPVGGIGRMGRLAQAIIRGVLDAYTARDVEGALNAWRRDEEVDEMNTSLFRELLTYMMEDPRNITPCIHLLFIAKNIERIGDHATNVAETIHYQETGTHIAEERPKGDDTALAVVEPRDG